MEVKDIISIIAIIISPIVAVLVGQILQNREKKRADKMEVFKTLMVFRGLGWTPEKVKALNMIEVVFSNDKNVLNQWKIYYDRLCVENPNETELLKIKNEGDKLLEEMAKSLGYKDKVTWETIQKPYIPQGLLFNMSQQQQFKNAQLDAISKVSEYMHQMEIRKEEDSTSNNRKKGKTRKKS